MTMEIRNAAPASAGAVTAPHQPLSAAAIGLLAAACGLSVASIYFAHPLLDAIGASFAFRPGSVGIVVTSTQIGYAFGLLFIVPLGDRLDRRRLIVGQFMLSAAALVVVGLAPTISLLLAGLLAVGLLAVAIQVMVALAADLAPADKRGRTVGIATSGVVAGILLSRLFAGVVSDLGGWRLVYLSSAVLTFSMGLLLLAVLPRHERRGTGLPYVALLVSTLTLLREEPVLRARSVLALLIFASFNVLWAPLALAVGGPPHFLSHTEIGLFGLAGIAGALAANKAGQLADEGFGQRVTGLSLALMLAAWIPIGLMARSLWLLTAGIILLDLAIQAVHVSSQSMLFALRPEARSRLVGIYMTFYSIGSASGAIAATSVYAHAGWAGVCVLGGAIGGVGLLVWSFTRRQPA